MKTKRAQNRKHLQLLFLGITALAGACDKSDEMQAALDGHRTGWDQRISALKARTSDLEQRFKQLPPPSGKSTVTEQVQRRRLQASIIGTRQTLFDIQSHVADSARELETASRQGNAEGQEALNGVIARTDEFVRQQEQALAANEEAMTRMGGARP
jgi:hypothetical protein